MKRYTYKITGEYRDWVEIKKGDMVIHNGSVFRVLTYEYDKLVSKLNYGTDRYYTSEIKQIGDLIVMVPLREDNLKGDYKYIPLVLNAEEYQELIEISYIDRNLLENIQKVNKNDICNILLNNFKNEFQIMGRDPVELAKRAKY